MKIGSYILEAILIVFWLLVACQAVNVIVREGIIELQGDK